MTRVPLGIISIALLASSLNAGEPARSVVHLLDPRLIAATDNTLAIEWHKETTDIIATRALVSGEAGRLLPLLEKELTLSTDVPFCGHHPAYAIQKLVDGKPTSTITLCGLCHTWAHSRGEDKLRVLKGDKAINYLATLLPLPEVFRNARKPSDLIDSFLEHKKPFYLLTAADLGSTVE